MGHYCRIIGLVPGILVSASVARDAGDRDLFLATARPKALNSISWKNVDVTLIDRQPKHLVLSRPFRGRVHEASHSHSARQPALDRSLDKIGSEECERDRHIDFSDAAP